jgi:hypothetical protein
MDEKYEDELHRYKENLFNILLASIAIAVLLNFLAWWFWDMPATKSGRSGMVFGSITVVLGPVVWYIDKFHCPRCKNLWSQERNDPKRNFTRLMWVASGWGICSSCGLSVDPVEEELEPHEQGGLIETSRMTGKE